MNCLLGGTLKLCDGRTVYSGLNPSGGIKISAFNNEGRNKTTTVLGGFKKKKYIKQNNFAFWNLDKKRREAARDEGR